MKTDLRTIKISAAAKQFGLTRKLIRTWAKDGKVRSFRDGRVFHVYECDIAARIELLTQGTAPDVAPARETTSEVHGQPRGTDGLGQPFPRPGCDISDLLPPPNERRFSHG